MNTNGNGSHLTKSEFRWLMGILIAVLFTLTTAFATRLNRVDAKNETQDQSISSLQSMSSVSENKIETLGEVTRDIKAELKEIKADVKAITNYLVKPLQTK